MNKTKKLPKWFDGTHYTEGEIVKNPFSGEEMYLNSTELSMYDFIMGCQYMIEMKGGLFHPKGFNIQKDMAKGLSWFRTANAKAYMVLLD
jgi:hypothetical protein